MPRLVPLAVALAALTAASPALASDPEAPRPSTALLVIDIQNFYFQGRLALERPEAAAARARAALDRFRALGWPVVHVQHLPKGVDTADPDMADAAYRIHPTVRPLPGEVVIGKHHANAFRDTALADVLRRLGITRLVICGMQTHMCVEAAARAAADAGFDVVVLHDACATRALAFGGTTVAAGDVHASTLATLQGSYAAVLSTDEFLATLPVPSGP